MKKSIPLFRILCIEIWIWLMPLSLLAQQRVIISPFYSDYAALTDSLPEGWSMSPYIQLGVKVVFPQDIKPSSLKQYQFENSTFFSGVFRPFLPVTLQYGQLKWTNLNLINWNTPELSRQDLQHIETKQGCFSLLFNDCSVIAGSLINRKGVPSFSYIHYEGWGTLFPTNAQRSDTTSYILHVNPSLFYLLTDKGVVDLYTTDSITILPHEKLPSLFFFYKPVYEFRNIKYKGISISLFVENEVLAAKLHREILSDTSHKSSDNTSYSSIDPIPADSMVYCALNAIDHIAALSNEGRKNIAIAKTGLRYNATMGEKENLDTLSVRFSLTIDSVLLVDNEMYYQPTLLHELLHFVIGHHQIIPNDLSEQEKNFFTESITEYLAKYLFGKYIAHKNMFMDSMEYKNINSTMLKKARRNIQTNKKVSVGSKGSEEAANTAWVYYDLFPILLHQLAVCSKVDEKNFATAVYRYVKERSNDKPLTLQNFFSYLKEQGFHFQKRQKNNICFLLQN